MPETPTAHPTAPTATPGATGLRAVPGGVWALGFVSMLMDISSEMVHALLPLYMVTVLGTSVLAVGLIEGIAEATASVTKVFSGALSDRLGRRKLLAVVGYALGALTRPVFPLASTLEWLVGARFVDRVGKGIRGAPRDALVADITPAHLRGAAFGLRQTLDTIGSFTGPLLAMGLMWWTANHFQTVFWVAVVPAVLAVVVLVFAVREPPPAAPRQVRAPLSRQALARLGTPYWWVVGLGVVFTLGRFSEAFLILRAQSIGLPLMWAPAVLVVMGVAYAVSAYPAGVLSDRVRFARPPDATPHGHAQEVATSTPGPVPPQAARAAAAAQGLSNSRTAVLGAGLVLLLSADLVLAFAGDAWGLALGVALWGLHMGFTQGLFNALVADHAPAELRGTAFGMFNLLTGLALLLASVIAGALWDVVGHRGTFLAGAGLAVLTMAGLAALHWRLRHRQR